MEEQFRPASLARKNRNDSIVQAGFQAGATLNGYSRDGWTSRRRGSSSGIREFANYNWEAIQHLNEVHGLSGVQLGSVDYEIRDQESESNKYAKDNRESRQ
jgi:hypothetical protein